MLHVSNLHDLTLNHVMIQYVENRHAHLRELDTALKALNPTAILERGYSITRTIDEKLIVTDPADIELQEKLEILIAKG